MVDAIDSIIIGGGQAGLATSYCLRERGREHVVLEQAAQAGNAWRNGRWDSFALVTPNWSFRLPGADYGTGVPDGFMPRDEVVASFEDYVRRFDLPVHFGVHVTSVEPNGADGGYLVRTDGTEYKTRNVVMATGPFQRPRIPAFGSNLPARITQIHSGEYRDPDSTPDGAVLVVGSAQSGCQIADELYRGGRRVYLCTGSAGRAPRRYRGKDIVKWMDLMGLFDMTPESLPSPKAKFEANPHVTGAGGGRGLNLHQFAGDGVVLLGHLESTDDDAIVLRNDLRDNLAKGDKFESDVAGAIDVYIAEQGLDAPEEALPKLDDGYRVEEIRELSLSSAGITTVIWAMGYEFDFSLVKLPVFDETGYPLHNRGVTRFPGLYFMGLPWMSKRKSALLLGVGEDADFVASAISTEERI